jgi:hypothetical protein
MMISLVAAPPAGGSPAANAGAASSREETEAMAAEAPARTIRFEKVLFVDLFMC